MYVVGEYIGGSHRGVYIYTLKLNGFYPFCVINVMFYCLAIMSYVNNW